MLCVVNTLVMATSWPFMGTWSTLAKIEFLSSLVTTILVPLQTPLVMLRRAMTGAPTLSLRTWAGSRPSLLNRYSSGYWPSAWAFWSVVLLSDTRVCVFLLRTARRRLSTCPSGETTGGATFGSLISSATHRSTSVRSTSASNISTSPTHSSPAYRVFARLSRLLRVRMLAGGRTGTGAWLGF